MSGAPDYGEMARGFREARDSGDPAALRQWGARWTAGLEPGGDPRIALSHTHGFANWEAFAAYLEALAQPDSRVHRFEAAVQAIIDGDAAALARLLLEDRELVRGRSPRRHRSTLLHYVSANGVEDFRQKTPPNIAGIAELLLAAGADVNAESEAYGGRSTTLGLTATSCHPEAAGVQIELMELLLAHGARIGEGMVNDCLRNGRGAAAAFFAGRGAALDLEGAAGTGRLDLVRSSFPGATEEQRTNGFGWACEFGHTAVAGFLLEHGVDVHGKLRYFGQTGLHWAAYGGHPDTVRLLLSHGARVDVKDEKFAATPLDWAQHQRNNVTGAEVLARYDETIALLAEAGAERR